MCLVVNLTFSFFSIFFFNFFFSTILVNTLSSFPVLWYYFRVPCFFLYLLFMSLSSYSFYHFQLDLILFCCFQVPKASQGFFSFFHFDLLLFFFLFFLYLFLFFLYFNFLFLKLFFVIFLLFYNLRNFCLYMIIFILYSFFCFYLQPLQFVSEFSSLQLSSNFFPME